MPGHVSDSYDGPSDDPPPPIPAFFLVPEQNRPCRKCNGRGVFGDGGDATICPWCLGDGTD